jgi:hypothetical protein
MRILLWLVKYWHGVGSFLQAALTPLIAALAVWIAYQQSQTAREQYAVNRRQYRLALFEKRLAVFNRTMQFIGDVMTDFDPKIFDGLMFMREARDYDFLFGPEVAEFLNELFKQGNALSVANSTVKQTHSQSALDEKHRVEKWFLDQHAVARTLFRKYLDLSEPL